MFKILCYVNGIHRAHIHSHHIIYSYKTCICYKLSFLGSKQCPGQKAVLEHVCVISVHIKSTTHWEPSLPSPLGTQSGAWGPFSSLLSAIFSSHVGVFISSLLFELDTVVLSKVAWCVCCCFMFLLSVCASCLEIKIFILVYKEE